MRDARVQFAPGETRRTLTVDVAGDRVIERTETFVVRLAAPSALAIDPTRQAALGTILDDDATTVADLVEQQAPGASGPRLTVGSPRWSRGRILVTVACPAAARSCDGRVTLLTVAVKRARIKALRRPRRVG